MREVVTVLEVPSSSPEKPPSASFAAAAPSQPRPLFFLSLTCGPADKWTPLTMTVYSKASSFI